MIHYINDSLFASPNNRLLIHSCNAQGVWGSGIAKQFKELYPLEYGIYNYYCETTHLSKLLGSCLIVNKVGCLITSSGYGYNVDIPATILFNTKKALADLISKTTMEISMPKINSGLFKVPWEETESILKTFNREFYVYEGIK